MPEVTQILHDAFRTVWLARLAGVAAMQDQPMMGVLQEFFRNGLQQLQLNLQGCFTERQTGPVGDPENVCVHGDGRLSESRIKHDIGCFSSHTG